MSAFKLVECPEIDMEARTGVFGSAIQFFGELFKTRRDSHKPSSARSETQRNSMSTTSPVTSLSTKSAKGSVFEWKSVETHGEPSSDNRDALPSPAIRNGLSPVPTTSPVTSSSSKSAKSSVFEWKSVETHGEPSSDSRDALPSPAIRNGLSPVPKTPAPKAFFANRYFMGHEKRGVAVIINNRHFHASLGMPERKGTDEDAKALSNALQLLHFEVFQYDNLSTHNMSEAMKYFASLDHSMSDCFLTAVLTHGDEGVLFGEDGKMTVERLLQPFKGSKSLTLAGKPKIFIFQACRGDRLDRGVDLVQADDNGGVYRLPSEADFLLAYSTIPGFYSWRNTDNGSWYIQALAKMINVHYGHAKEKDPRWEPEIDFLRLLTRVNYEVAYFYRSSVPTNPELDQQKQVPSIVSMLTRDLFFPAKGPAT